jgi:hypothetical protein
MKPVCFIIMPISTPGHLLETYEGDIDHFDRVLKNLFVPAVKSAGFDAIPPSSKGSAVIHGDIISRLQTADMVLCDISTLNANVFFELGIRTALHRPVALVKDDVTESYPFDTSPIQAEPYSSAMKYWEVSQEMPKLAKHIQACAKQSKGKNTLWSYFGLSETAKAPDPDSPVEQLRLEVGAMRNALQHLILPPEEATRQRTDRILNSILRIGERHNLGIHHVTFNKGAVHLIVRKEIPQNVLSEMMSVEGVRSLQWDQTTEDRDSS